MATKSLYDSKSNKEKFSELSTKKKTEYIWDYYKWHIIGGILAIFAVVEIVKIATAPPAPKYDTHVVVAGKVSMEDEKVESLEQQLNEKFNADIQVMGVDWQNMSQGTIAYDQKLMVMTSVRELDMYLVSRLKYDTFMNVEDFDPFIGLDTIPEFKTLLEENKDQLILKKSAETGEEHVYGIRMNAIKGIPELKVGEELVFALVNPPKDMQKAIEVAKYLLQ